MLSHLVLVLSYNILDEVSKELMSSYSNHSIISNVIGSISVDPCHSLLVFAFDGSTRESSQAVETCVAYFGIFLIRV